MFSAWIKLLPALRRNDRQEICRVFQELPALSIDYALIEKIYGSLMSPGDFWLVRPGFLERPVRLPSGG